MTWKKYVPSDGFLGNAAEVWTSVYISFIEPPIKSGGYLFIWLNCISARISEKDRDSSLTNGEALRENRRVPRAVLPPHFTLVSRPDGADPRTERSEWRENTPRADRKRALCVRAGLIEMKLMQLWNSSSRCPWTGHRPTGQIYSFSLKGSRSLALPLSLHLGNAYQ